MMIIYGKRDKSIPHMFFCYPKLPKCDNSRGYSGFYRLLIIYGKRDKVSKEKLKSFSNTITSAVTSNFKVRQSFMERETQRFVDKSLKLSENFQSTINMAFQSFFLKSTIYGKGKRCTQVRYTSGGNCFCCRFLLS